MIHALTERHLLPMPTSATGRRSVGRIDFHQLVASLFRFAHQLIEEGRPRRITDRFGEAMMMNHPVHVEILNTDHAKGIHHTAALLMGEVLSFAPDTFMHTGYRLAVLAPLWGAFGKFGVFPLHASQDFLFCAKKAGVLNVLPIGERCKGLSPTSMPTLSVFSGKRSGSTSWECTSLSEGRSCFSIGYVACCS